MASFTSSLKMLVIILYITSIKAYAQELSTNFYDETCPNLISTVKPLVENIVANEPRMGATLLRLHFHDCFVNGCDGSVLLDVIGGEKESVHNIRSIRGFDEIDRIKKEVEYVCPGVVSCADILTLVAREAVVYLGGPSWSLEYGRKDSTTSATAGSADNQLPFGNADLSDLVSFFDKNGFSVGEMVALSGAHTIGQARCVRFRNRIYGEPNINPEFAQSLQQICPATAGTGDDNLAPLDPTSNLFNNDYYLDLTYNEGLLHSDQVLFTGSGSETDQFVQLYATDQNRFFSDFMSVMLKMGRLGVKIGDQGIIRTNCRVVN
ncbi:hypothetical protein RND81_01G026000 [Saponaria officinalis]|uniref:Peroxidase n=1 Tax=Saponaria officinalis TaxID=3572 RepID=A0AAW1NBF7_SAPOF